MKKHDVGGAIITVVNILIFGTLGYFGYKLLSKSPSDTAEGKLTAKYDDIPEGKSSAYYSGFSDGLEYVKKHFIEFCETNKLGFDYYYEGLLEGYDEGYSDAVSGSKRKR